MRPSLRTTLRGSAAASVPCGLATPASRARAAFAALGTAIAAFAAVALLSRLQPDLFPTAAETADFFSPNRLAFPINYWNGNASLIAMGVPLLLYLDRAPGQLRRAAIPARLFSYWLAGVRRRR